MAIYTKTGDSGDTAILGGKRVSKSHPYLEALGSIDELSSFLAFACVGIINKKYKELFASILKDFYEIMGFLGRSVDKKNSFEKRIGVFEKEIDILENKTGKIHNFILPLGSETACRLHLARTVCRRAERSVVRYRKLEESVEKKQKILLIIKYLNRLSDLLFMLARYYNKGHEISLK